MSFVQERFLFSDIAKKLFKPDRSFLSGCPDLWILFLGHPAWRKGSVSSQLLITAEMKRWMSISTSRERTQGSRALASWVNPASWHYQRAGKWNYMSSGHVLQRSCGCHSYLCTTWHILCMLGFIYSRKSQFKYPPEDPDREGSTLGSRPHWSVN